MAKIFFTDGSEKEVSPKNGSDFSLEELQGVVGGYIQILYLDNGELMIVNEEGKLDGLPFNKKATDYVVNDGKYIDVIVGNVLVCDSKEVK